jgi:TolB-like protein
VRSRPSLILGFTFLAALGPLIGGARIEGAGIALFPTQNRAGDSPAAAALDRTLRFELSNYGHMIGPERTRDALRQLRIRNGDLASPELLRLLGEELGVVWLVSATLHDAERRLVPRLTVSARIYSGKTGELLWAGFQGGSGIDRRKLLGLGTIQDLESLVPLVARDLLTELPEAPGDTAATDPRTGEPFPTGLGTVAVVPFAGSTGRRATANAETATEAALAQLFRGGVRLVSPNRSHEILRRLQGGQWGGVDLGTRMALARTGGADTILTGAIETYDVGGSEFEPEPRVAVGLRLLDAETGRILWAGSLERAGWDRRGVFGLGRIYSRGALIERMMEILAKRLHRDHANDNSG